MPKKLIVDFCQDDVKSHRKMARAIIFQMRKEWTDLTLYVDLEFLNKEMEVAKQIKEESGWNVHGFIVAMNN